MGQITATRNLVATKVVRLAGQWRNNNVIITSKRRHFDVITSKRRRFDVITTSLLRKVSTGVLPYWQSCCHQARTVEQSSKLRCAPGSPFDTSAVKWAACVHSVISKSPMIGIKWWKLSKGEGKWKCNGYHMHVHTLYYVLLCISQ